MIFKNDRLFIDFFIEPAFFKFAFMRKFSEESISSLTNLDSSITFCNVVIFSVDLLISISNYYSYSINIGLQTRHFPLLSVVYI